jgi:hypothetical protein
MRRPRTLPLSTALGSGSRIRKVVMPANSDRDFPGCKRPVR